MPVASAILVIPSKPPITAAASTMADANERSSGLLESLRSDCGVCERDKYPSLWNAGVRRSVHDSREVVLLVVVLTARTEQGPHGSPFNRGTD
jgi:hypothetical protein